MNKFVVAVAVVVFALVGVAAPASAGQHQGDPVEHSNK